MALVDYDKILKLKAESAALGSMSMAEIYKSIKKTLLNIPKDTAFPDGEKLFKTVKIDNGQFERIISPNGNTEYDIPFPAAFVRFINVRYLVEQNRTSEGRATMRIRYVLNRLNNQTDENELEPLYTFDRINNAIQDAKDEEVSLSERCNLQYWDMPLSTNMLQAYWLDYEIYFKADESYQYRNWIQRKIITPRFTNFSDIPGDTRPDVTVPNWDDQSAFYSPPFLDYGFWNLNGVWSPIEVFRK